MPLDIPAIGADWYVANLHKWMFCPKGTAFLWTVQQRQEEAQSVVISHEYRHHDYRERFMMQGTIDDTAFLAVPRAVAFAEAMGGLRVIADHNHQLVAWAAHMLARRWGTEILVPTALCGSMAVVRCPFDAASPEEDLFSLVWDRFSLVVPVIPMPGMPGVWIRVSAQIYNERGHYEKLADAVLLLLAERCATAKPLAV